MKPILQITETEAKSHNLQAAWVAENLNPSVDASAYLDSCSVCFFLNHMHLLLFPFKISIKGYTDASTGREIFLEGLKKKKKAKS